MSSDKPLVQLSMLQRITYSVLLFGCFMLLIIYGRPILIPFAFAAFFSFLLLPVCRWYERFMPWKILAVSLTFLTFFVLLAGIFAALGAQIVELFNKLPGIGNSLQKGFLEAFTWVNEKIPFTESSGEQWLVDGLQRISMEMGSYIGPGLTASAGFLVNIGLTVVYTFLLLLYRSAFKQFFIIQFSKDLRDEAENYLDSIRKVGQGYIFGLLLVMLIIAILYSIGLALIGIKYALFWGVLGGILVFIPYIGTFIGGLLPFVYAIVTTDTVWQPLSIVALIAAVQSIEGNLITPRVVGEAVGINPLFSIVAIVIGGTVWGIPGVILAIPFIGILRVTLGEFDRFKTLDVLLGTEISHGEEKLNEMDDEERYRILEDDS